MKISLLAICFVTFLVLFIFSTLHAASTTTITKTLSLNSQSDLIQNDPPPRLREPEECFNNRPDCRTPFQKGIKKGLENRRGRGQDTPDENETSFETNLTRDGNKVEIRGKSTLHFKNPRKAGKDKWDDFIINNFSFAGLENLTVGNHSTDKGNLTITNLTEGNLTQMVIDALPEMYGNESAIINANISGNESANFTYGEEPREYTVEENYTLTFPNESEAIAAFAILSNNPDLISDPITMGNVLMGFTIAPPRIDWTISTRVRVCFIKCVTVFRAKAGFELEIAFGLRLPAKVNITTPGNMTVEHDYVLDTSLVPLDFSAADYAALGVPSFDGAEFVAKFVFFLGVKVEVVGVDVINWAIDADVNLARLCTQFTRDSPELSDVDCENFVTPFADGREFPLPTVTLNPDVTGLQFSWAGASIGIGLKIDPEFGSDKITADFTGTGDSSGNGVITYTDDFPTTYSFGPITANDLAPSDDFAHITLDDFRFFFTRMIIRLSANIQLGGWLSFVPDIPYFEIVEFNIADLGTPSLGQHSGTPGVTADVFVQNFGIDVEVTPVNLSIEPGFWGNYTVTVTNIGNVPDDFDTFEVLDLLPGWQSDLGSSLVSLDRGDSTSFNLGINPRRHYTTSPGDYPFRVRGRSLRAPLFDLVRTDTDSAITHALPFFEPHVEINPLFEEIKPGQKANYTILVQNFGNVNDSINLTLAFLDFDGLYRAVPTVIQLAWTMLDASFFGPLVPGGSATTSFMITVPSIWEGMENSTYMYEATTTSNTDPTAQSMETADLKVIATKESMARFIDLEIQSLIDDVNSSAINQNLKDSLLDKLVGAKVKKEVALGYILANNFNNADNALGSVGNKMDAFQHQVQVQRGKSIPIALADNWIARGQAVVTDAATAIAITF